MSRNFAGVVEETGDHIVVILSLSLSISLIIFNIVIFATY
jgi:hypothetical protein